MKILCDKCGGTVAHVIGKSLVEAVRQGHKFSVVGKDYSVMLSCPNTGECNNKIAITVENGEVLLDNLKREEVKENGKKEEPKKPEPKSPESGDDGGGKKEEGDDEGKDGKGKSSQKEPEPSKGDEGGDDKGKEGEGDNSEGATGGAPKERKFTRV